MMRDSIRYLALILLFTLGADAAVWSKKPKKSTEPSPLDQYVEQAMRSAAAQPVQSSPGSIWSPDAAFLDLTRELRASRVDDMITILVAERASAVAKGATKTSRSSNASASINALGGKVRVGGPWANLANMKGTSALDGGATTSRDMALTTTLTARVTHVLPNGYLVIEGSKDIQVNSEHQAVMVRGVIRPADVSPNNQVRSDHIAQMEIRLNGKGVVNDSIRRPFFLYRLLLGLLPF